MRRSARQELDELITNLARRSRFCEALDSERTDRHDQPSLHGGVARSTDGSDCRCLEIGRELISEDAGDRHRFERCPDHMGRPSAVRVVGRLRFEQLRVRENHSELIVQAMQKGAKIAERGGVVATFDHFQG